MLYVRQGGVIAQDNSINHLAYIVVVVVAKRERVAHAASSGISNILVLVFLSDENVKIISST